MFANLGLHLRRLSSRRIIRSQRVDAAHIQSTLEFYVRSLAALAEAGACSILVYNPDTGKAWVDVGTRDGDSDVQVPMKDTLIGDVIASGKPLVASDFHGRDEGYASNRPGAAMSRNAAYVPIRSRFHNEVIGVIEVVNKAHGKEFGGDDIALLEQAAEGVRDLVDSVFLDQKVHANADELLFAGGPAVLTMLGLALFGSLLTMLMTTAMCAIPNADHSMSLSLASFVP
jgi:signal transduction protein with GAF and PtsI domain